MAERTTFTNMTKAIEGCHWTYSHQPGVLAHFWALLTYYQVLEDCIEVLLGTRKTALPFPEQHGVQEFLSGVLDYPF